MTGTLSRVGHAMWQLYSYDSLGSTSDMARDLPAWSAVCAARQTSGRGRFGRAFVSDEGGLWISAVLPTGPDPSRWAGFSLAVGNYLLRMLARLGIANARLRWPNDLMYDGKKFAGILIEQGTRETLTVGLGMNVSNAPWDHMPELAGTTTRLSDILEHPPSVSDLTVLVLDALADAHEAMLGAGLPEAIDDFNAHLEPRKVRIFLSDGKIAEGYFTGLNPAGNLRLLDSSGTQTIIEHPRVERLHET